MKYSGIGGQAVMEGVMMRNGSRYAIAVRLADQSIHVDVEDDPMDLKVWDKIPIIRGILVFIHSLIVGISSLMKSATYFEEESEPKSEEEKKKKEHRDRVELGGTFAFSLVIAFGIFLLLPYFLSKGFSGLISSNSVQAFIEGIIRGVIFILYIVFISKMEDIRRVFMYHGAEHKCINCVEHGMNLTVENVKKSSREHKRCGTSFVFLVFLVSIFVFMFIRMDSHVLQILCRIALMPVIAGISYEFIRLAGKKDGKVVDFLSKPGLLLQKLTTKEPDEAMIEVGIASVEAVFDWKKFIEENKENF